MGPSVSKKARPGPEKETLIERFVSLSRLPYWLGCIVLTILIGPLGNVASLYAGGFSASDAIDKTMTLWIGGNGPPLESIASLTILDFLFFYAIYMIRFMRARIIAAEADVSSLLDNGEGKFHKAFGSVSSPWPPILLGAIIFLFLSSNLQGFLSEYAVGLIGEIYLVIAYSIFFVTMGTFVCVYFGGIRGLYSLGRLPLKLMSFQEDPNLGVKPIGTLSLSFAFVYFVALGIAALADLLTPNPIDPNFLALLVVLMMVGVVIFFLPLQAIHGKMLQEKQRERRALRDQILSTRRKPLSGGGDAPAESLAEIKDTLSKLTTALALDATRSEIEAIPTWPFDTGILSKFAVIIISVLTILIAKVITNSLHI
jgi:hypothetical protein